MMCKGKFVFPVFVFLILTAFASVSAAKTIYVPDDYEKIQWAVNHASAGDTIIVRDETYYESITVSKQLTIKSENGPENCIVNGTGSDVFTLEADGIRIEGLTITGGRRGIYILSNNNTIINNNISNNWDGIELDNSNNNSISNNNIGSNKWNGIFLYYSNNNIISNNIISSNKWYGIYLEDSNENTIRNNEFINDGLLVDNSYGNIVEDNKVNGKPLVYLEGESDEFIYDAGQVILIKCKNITVMNAEIKNTDVGIELFKSNNCLISNNNISSNNHGIYFDNSNKNSISENDIISNNRHGIYLLYSNNNIISNNIISSNNYGISLWYSNNNSISENNIISNNYIDLWYSNNNSISNNNISSNKWNGIWLEDSNNNIISDNIICSNKWNGIFLGDSSNNNNISKNNISSNYYGIGLSYSNKNSISENDIGSNNRYGIWLEDSNNNIIYLNNFIKNTCNAHSSYSKNIWNSTEPITYTYRGSEFTNYMGNYWDDYKGSDANGDGIGETPYSIDSDKDNYPLIERFENYFVGMPTPTPAQTFDTGRPENPYPSISGKFIGTIRTNKTITATKLYTLSLIHI